MRWVGEGAVVLTKNLLLKIIDLVPKLEMIINWWNDYEEMIINTVYISI